MPQKLTAELPKLTWLFIAYFEDGSVITQTQESEIGNSAMVKVAEKQKESKLLAFQLKQTSGQGTVLVDLLTGTFIVNGTLLQAHNQAFNPAMYDLDLVYFRERQESVNVTKTENGEQVLSDPQTLIGRYFVGWKTQVHNKTKQVTLAVA